MGIEVFWGKKKSLEVERKVRSDKKQQVAPTISVKLKTEIERLAFITDQPVKRIGELLSYEGIHNRDITEQFVPYLQKGILRVEKTLFYGSKENPSLRDRTNDDKTDRISIRFEQRDFVDIETLADLLYVSPTRTVALLLDAGIRHPEIVEYILQKHTLRNPLEDMVLSEIRKLMRYINRNNPYKMARWNEKFERYLHDTKQVTQNIKLKLPSRAIDTESYKWNLDQELLPGKVPPEI